MKRLIVIVSFACLVAVGTAVAVEVSPLVAIYKPPLPERIEDPEKPATQEQIDLGRMLYYDTRFSIGQNISCNTCHDLANYGVDHKPVSLGHKNQPGTRNSPTVYNAAAHFAQFWDGRAATVEEQAVMPVLNPIEMAMPSKEYVLQVLKSMPGYVEAFKKAFPGDSDPVTFENFGNAIGAFERGLVTPAPWDKFLAGDKNAISDEAKEGFNVFVTKGCMTCHLGTYLGGNSYQKLGVIKPWPNQEDQGRFEVTKNATDKMMFKTPSLRNVTKTAPYFHDGSVESLEQAIRMMGEYQFPAALTDADVKKLVAFFETLTGEIPMDYIEKPELPPSSDKTPKPQIE